MPATLQRSATSPIDSTLYYTPTSEAVRDVGRAFGYAYRHPSARTEGRLRTTIRSAVRRLKRNGVPPERVIVALKRSMVAHNRLGAPLSLVRLSASNGDECIATYGRAFTLIVDAYYEDC